ncbi:fatty acid desaturase [Candidatus Nitrospira bockiana]
MRRISQLAEPDEWQWVRRALLDWAVIVAAVVVTGWLDHPVAFVLAALIIAVKQHALAILAHDGAHRLVSRNRRLNDLLTNLFCFWPLGFPLEGYRRFHFQHHRATGTDQDPELIHKRAFGQWEVPITSRQLTMHALTDLLGAGIPHLAMAAYLTRAVSFVDGIMAPLFWLVTGTVAWLAGQAWIVILWWASLLFCLWPIFRLRMWTEHGGTHGTHRISAGLLARALILPHNTYMHWEHHEFPMIPCWNLPRVRDLIAAPTITSLPHLFRALRQPAAPDTVAFTSDTRRAASD